MPIATRAAPDTSARLAPDRRATVAPLRNGHGDPTTVLEPRGIWRATTTPDGPATVHAWWTHDVVDADAWGAGRAWVLDRVASMVGEHDGGVDFVDGHPLVLEVQRRHPSVRIGASGNLYHELLPTIVAQRITGGEAVRQWRNLCERLGEPAPGPARGLLLPPSPTRLATTPAWAFHPLGIEAARARALVEAARHADRLWGWATLEPAEAARRLGLLPGVGPWTIGTVLGTALGDPDAVAVGDYHLPNVVAFALAGEPRATDARMLELLAPYAGQRNRALRLVMLAGLGAPRFGPRRRVLPMHRW
jgi:hypothetical protein